MPKYLKFSLIAFSFLFLASSVNAATYYVGKTGSDSNTCEQAQNEATPKLTISAGIACAGAPGTSQGAGQSVVVADGVYTEELNNNMPNGAPDNYFVLKAKNPRGATVNIGFEQYGFRVDLYASWIEIDGFIWNGVTSSSGGFAFSTDGSCGINHIRIVNNEFNIPAGNSTSHSCDIYFGSNSVHNFFQADPVYNHALYLGRGSERWTIENNEIYHINGYCIHAYDDSNGTISDLTIRYNSLHHCGQDTGQFAIISQSQGAQIYGNVIYSNGGAGDSGGGIQLGYGSVNNEVYNNTFYDNNTFGIYNRGFGNIIQNNMIINSVLSAISYEASATSDNNICSDSVFGCTIAEPVFVNPSSGDFNLQSNSPAIDAGAVIPGITAGYIGFAPDIGACEYGSGDSCPREGSSTPSTPLLLPARTSGTPSSEPPLVSESNRSSRSPYFSTSRRRSATLR